MLLITETELSSIMNSESSAALGHHHQPPHTMLGDHVDDPEMFTARTYTTTTSTSCSPGKDFHHSPSAQSPPMAVAVSSDGQLQQHHINNFPELVAQQQHPHIHQHQQQPTSPHHQWDINDTVLPVPKVHDPFCLWPTGHCRRTYRGDSDDARRHVSGWAMRNTNNHNALILKKSCLGVLVCSRDCVLDNGRKVHLRPAICDKARRKQLAKPCPNPSCPGRLELLACRGHCGYPVTHFWRHLNGAVYFQAKGYHDHPRPDVKSLSDKGRNTFNKQIKHEGGRMLSLSSKRRFPILTNEAIPETKRIKQPHDEVLCSCPPFECVCPKSVKKEQLLHQQQQQHLYQQQHQFTTIPPDYPAEPHPTQHQYGSTRAAMPGTDHGYPLGSLPPHPPPPFTQINITNTCLPPTASLDLNIPSVEIVAGCYSSNTQLHVPDQHHYNSLQSYAFQQHKAQFDYPHSNYPFSDTTQKASHNLDKSPKHTRQGFSKSEEKRRKLDNVNVTGDKDIAQFPCKFTPTEQRSDSTLTQESQLHNGIPHQQDFQSVDNRHSDFVYVEMPQRQIPCDFDKTAIALDYKSRDDSLAKTGEIANINNTGSDDGRLHASDANTRNNCQVIPGPHYETPVSDSSFLYDTISTVFGADQRRPSDQNNSGLVSPAQEQAKGDEVQHRRPRESSQSPPQVYNFLESYTTPHQGQGPSPPIYTELTSPPRQEFTHQNDNIPCSTGHDLLPATDHQYYPYRVDSAANLHTQNLHLHQQYHPHHYHQHHNNQPQHQPIETSPSQTNTSESYSPSLSQQNIVRSHEMSNENHYGLYSHAPSENTHLCHSTNLLNYSSYSAVTPHSHFNDYSSHPLHGDSVGTGNVPCSYESTFSSSGAASQQAYRNRSINITLTYN